MKWFLIYSVSLFALWHAIDLEADTVFASAIAPLAFFFILVASLIWLSVKMGGRSSTTGDAGGMTSGGFFGGGGDSCGGGGGDGGGC